jgi:gliding motility-associated-like protein
VWVRRVDCKAGFAFYAPTALAPGSVQGNGLFMLTGDDLEVLDFQVFDRWGNLVFQQKNTTTGWDGLAANGRDLTPGVYLWTAQLRQRGRVGWVGGDVLLVR